MNGCLGPSAFGSMGYAKVDARFAKKVVAITDHLVPYPANPISIPQTAVDCVVQVERIGDPQLIRGLPARPGTRWSWPSPITPAR